MTNKQQDELIQRAIEVSKNAYSPYSKFPVGAALLCKNGEVFVGCNVENSSFGLTICAERAAMIAAIAAGQRDFVAIALVSKKAASPCGACRQFLNEFEEELQVLTVDLNDGELKHEIALSQLLPDSFRFGD